MSRVGKKPIELPKDVKASLVSGELTVQGPKGNMKFKINPLIFVKIEGDILVLDRADEERGTRAQHGLHRALIQNMVTGVTKGFEKKLEIVGVGYRAEVKGKGVVFNLGYSNPVAFPMPEGIDITVEKSIVTVSGCDKGTVGKVASEIRKIRPPEPYKGKGVRYFGEIVHRKVGKAAAGAGA
ncbi:50S ribosomal protein L6 [bacterium]|nr:50S ribosomal protein L6 [bacterium]